MSFWKVAAKMSKAKLSDVYKMLKLSAKLVESLAPEQIAQMMPILSSEQLMMAMEIYSLWKEVWKAEVEEKVSENEEASK